MNGKLILSKMGRKIKEIRLQKKLTQDKLSAETGIEKSMISRIESGRTNLTVRTMFKLSKVLEVPIMEFFKENSDQEHLIKHSHPPL